MVSRGLHLLFLEGSPHVSGFDAVARQPVHYGGGLVAESMRGCRGGLIGGEEVSSLAPRGG